MRWYVVALVLACSCRFDLPAPMSPPDDSSVDDGPRPPCPSQCTSCSDGKSCTIDCAAGAACNAQIVCPAGFDCTIRCNTPGACRADINCNNSASCAIECSGSQACEIVNCGPGPCQVVCTGQFSCEIVNCGQSCACDVTGCSMANSSCVSVQCPASQCDTGLGCSSTQSPVCKSCP